MTSTGTTALPLARGWFAGQFPGTTNDIEQLPGGNGTPYFIVAFNRKGQEVARADLQALNAHP